MHPTDLVTREHPRQLHQVRLLENPFPDCRASEPRAAKLSREQHPAMTGSSWLRKELMECLVPSMIVPAVREHTALWAMDAGNSPHLLPRTGAVGFKGSARVIQNADEILLGDRHPCRLSTLSQNPQSIPKDRSSLDPSLVRPVSFTLSGILGDGDYKPGILKCIFL